MAYIPTGRPRGRPRKDGLPAGSPVSGVASVSARHAAQHKVREVSSSHTKRAYRSHTTRDIAEVPEWSNFRPLDWSAINWERRLACQRDPILDLKTYFPNLFCLPWSELHIKLIEAIERKIYEGGKKIIAFPRRFGKTSICRGMIIRAMKYGMRKFSFFIGSKENKAIQTLEFIKANWYRNHLLQQDFPEFAYPIYRIEGRGGQAVPGQLYRGERTHLTWSANEIQLPTMLLSEEDAAGYLAHDPDAVEYLEEFGKYMLRGAGALIRVAGIDGSIRGEADVHPITLHQPRPDLVLLDDIVKDQKAESPRSTQRIVDLVESAIGYLAAPGVSQAVIWPGTVIREDDPTDYFLNREHKPEWEGERTATILAYPDGMDDDKISEETEQGKLWHQYEALLRESYQRFGNLKLANEFYRDHQPTLEAGFHVSWADMFVNTSPNPDINEVSAIQSAMNLRFTNPQGFLSEGQNRPRPKREGSLVLPTVKDIVTKVTGYARGAVASEWDVLTAFIDVQDEVLFWAILAVDHNFTGQFIDYGTTPHINRSYFTKRQTMEWAGLTRQFFHDHPGTDVTKKAPFEAKLYHGLRLCVDYLFSREFVTADAKQERRKLTGMAIDTQWGTASDTIKRFVRHYQDNRLVCYSGNAFLPGFKQLEEYNATPGWLFEHELHPHVKESTWVVKPYNKISPQRYILADINRLKTLLIQRMTTPFGSPGCISLFNDSPDNHRLFADHLVSSECPEVAAGRGMSKDIWKVRPGRERENDFLDCAAGCIALASICGASLKTPIAAKRNVANKQARPTLQEIYRNRTVRR